MDFELCLEQAKNLESVKRYDLEDSEFIKPLAQVIHDYYESGIRELPNLDKLVDSMYTS
jgi:hypothetical protein